MKAGSIVFVGGKARHGCGTNISGEARRAIATSFVLGWLRTQETRFLHTTVEQAQQWAQRARQLLGCDLYPHYDEALMAGPLDDYEYGSLPALFDNKT
jgi:ectoine hydroxylase-related dioxygenase (phytanoyl-CoA dioxygenase family)